MRDTAKQVVLDSFIATFLYWLLVLRTIRGLEEREFVPQLSVSLGVLLGAARLRFIDLFNTSLAIAIQASHIVKTACQDWRDAIDRIFPEEAGHEMSDAKLNRRRRQAMDLTRSRLLRDDQTQRLFASRRQRPPDWK